MVLTCLLLGLADVSHEVGFEVAHSYAFHVVLVGDPNAHIGADHICCASDLRETSGSGFFLEPFDELRKVRIELTTLLMEHASDFSRLFTPLIGCHLRTELLELGVLREERRLRIAKDLSDFLATLLVHHQCPFCTSALARLRSSLSKTRCLLT